jgi:cytochrome P450
VTLPKGARAAPSIYLAHREPAEWSEPLRFKPERFLDSAPAPFSYLPFGGGARRCIGMGFALLQMRVVAATILQRVTIEPAPGKRIRAIRRGVVLTPSDGMPIVARRR